MDQCNDCAKWYHCDCMGISEPYARALKIWRCPTCQEIVILKSKDNTQEYPIFRTPLGTVTVSISPYYCLAKAIQVIISKSNSEDGFENVRTIIFEAFTGLPKSAIDSAFLRLNGNSHEHVRAFVRGSLNMGMYDYRALVTCVAYKTNFKFVVFESFGAGTTGTGRDKM